MKVAFFIGSLNRGGTETLVLDTFRKKEIAAFESILIYRNEGELSDDYRATGVPMFRVKPKGLKLGYIFDLRKILYRENVSILHTQTLLNAFIGLFCVCFSHTKLVASFHGFFTSVKDRFLTHLVMWFADASFFVSGYVQKWYLKNTLFACPKRCYVVYNGIDFSKFDRMYITPDFLGKETVSSESCVRLCMVGSFVGGRSQLFICKCLKALRDKGIDNFHFFFVGKRSEAEPQLYEGCVRFCSDNKLLDRIHFVGGRGDVPAILQHIDGFVYSTNNDTFGIAVVEAMSVGLPVLVNDWDVMKEISCDGEYACLYKTLDIEDCVAKIESFLSNITDEKVRAISNAENIKERFSIESHIHNLYSIYCKI